MLLVAEPHLHNTERFLFCPRHVPCLVRFQVLLYSARSYPERCALNDGNKGIGREGPFYEASYSDPRRPATIWSPPTEGGSWLLSIHPRCVVCAHHYCTKLNAPLSHCLAPRT